MIDFTPTESTRADQCTTVLAALQTGPQTTLDLRRIYVASPASRVYDLKKQGHSIVTSRAGRFARYTLQKGA